MRVGPEPIELSPLGGARAASRVQNRPANAPLFDRSRARGAATVTMSEARNRPHDWAEPGEPVTPLPTTRDDAEAKPAASDGRGLFLWPPCGDPGGDSGRLLQAHDVRRDRSVPLPAPLPLSFRDRRGSPNESCRRRRDRRWVQSTRRLRCLVWFRQHIRRVSKSVHTRR